jgi:hypothetical protein
MRQVGGGPYALRLRCGRRPALGATGTPARCGLGTGGEGMCFTRRGESCVARGSRAAGFWRYDEILLRPPCGGRAQGRARLGGRIRICQRQVGGGPYRLRLAPSAISPRDVPLARRKMRAGARGGRGISFVRRGGSRVRRGEKEPQDFGGMTKSCCARPLGGGRKDAPAWAVASGFASVRSVEGPIACGSRLRRSARATCHWHVARCGPGAGGEGFCVTRRGESCVARGARAAGFGSVRCVESPTPFACAAGPGP